MLASSQEKSDYDAKLKQGKHHAVELLGQLASLIDMIDPSVRLGRKVNKNKTAILKDLTGSQSAS